MSHISDFNFYRIGNGYQIGGGLGITYTGLKISVDNLLMITVPKYYQQKPVIYLGSYCFAHLPYTITIFIPNTIEMLGHNAFYNSTQLLNIYFEEKSQLKYLESKVFDRCESLRTIILPPKIETFGTFGFCLCLSLKEIILTGSHVFDSTNSSNFWSSVSSTLKIYVPSSYNSDYFVTRRVIKDDSKYTSSRYFYSFKHYYYSESMKVISIIHHIHFISILIDLQF